MAFEITGKLYAKSEPKQVSERFRKCEFVVEIEDGKYPQLLAFEIGNDKIEQIASFQVGDVVHIEFNLRGREWKSPSGELKYFNSLNAWKVTPAHKTDAMPAPAAEDRLPF